MELIVGVPCAHQKVTVQHVSVSVTVSLACRQALSATCLSKRVIVFTFVDAREKMVLNAESFLELL